jgi:tRNA uridine 5-carboxymethylaminomethyl modification enzyme
VQREILNNINGLENVKVIRPGYAIEYDLYRSKGAFSYTRDKEIKNLYLAGQINGTTGYEEAAAQGLIAGVNAALSLKNMEPFILDRSDAYIGVMIDDLVTKGVAEPYRMFTSRAEYRLSLRSDNADLRLTSKGIKIGLVEDTRKEIFENKFAKFGKISLQMTNLNISPSKAEKYGIKIAKDGIFRTAEEILTQKNVDMEKIRLIWPEIHDFGRDIDEQIEINSHYRGYLKKQKADILAFKRDENLSIPDNIDYDQFSGLSNEVKAKFKANKPQKRWVKA